MLKQRNLRVRIAVGDRDGRRSTVWGIFSTGNELYAAHRTTAGIEKISFHSSRICRRAFVSTRPLPTTMSDRVIERWMRAETPPAGEKKAVAALTILFPEGHLSPDLLGTSKETIWLDAPPEGYVRAVQLFFTRETEDDVCTLIKGEGQQLVFFHYLENGEGVAVRSWINPWQQLDHVVPAGHHEVEDMVFPTVYTTGIIRPIAFTMYTHPDELCCIELTGFRVPAGEGIRRYPQAATLTRNTVLDRGNHNKVGRHP